MRYGSMLDIRLHEWWLCASVMSCGTRGCWTIGIISGHIDRLVAAVRRIDVPVDSSDAVPAVAALLPLVG